jgi:hypothetical protein
MAQTVRELETAGLVYRRPGPDDARRVFVELTPAGLEVLHARRAAAEDWLGHTLDQRLEPTSASCWCGWSHCCPASPTASSAVTGLPRIAEPL